MKNHFFFLSFLIYSCILSAQAILPDIAGQLPRNGKKIIARDSHQIFQTFVMRNEAGADEFRLLPDGSRKYTGTHHYFHLPADPRINNPMVTTTINFIFSRVPDAFFFSTDNLTYSAWDLTWVTSNTATLAVIPGNYDFIAYSGPGNKVLVKSGFQISDPETTIQVNFNESVHQVTFTGLDENGNSLGQSQGYKIVSCNVRFPLPRDMDYYTVLMSSGASMKINDFSGGFRLQGGFYCHDLAHTGKIYFLQFPVINSVDTSLVVTNNPQDYVFENLEFYWKPGTTTPNILTWNCVKNLREDGWFYFAFGQQEALGSTCWKGKLFLTPDVSDDIGFTTGFSILNSAELMPSWDETGFFRVAGDGLCNQFVIEPDTYIYPDGSTMTFGTGSAYFRNILVNNLDGPSSIRCYHDIYGLNDDPRYEYYYDAEYQLYDDFGNLISSGPYMNFTTGNYLPGRYLLQVSNNFCYFADSIGSHEVITAFDLRSEDPDPPQLTSFQVRNSASVPCYKLNVNEGATVRFSLGDYLVDTVIYYPDYTLIVWNYEPVINDSSRLFARVHGLTEWQDLPVNLILEDSAIGFLYEGDLTALTTHPFSRIDIKVSGCDPSGNTITHTWEPAVLVGEPATGSTAHNSFVKSDRLTAYPNPSRGNVFIEIQCDKPGSIT
ncbi:MAG: hypothetical protein WCI71_04875, partial [Bacteroidota bacterium]